MQREISFSAVVLGLALAVGATIGAIEGARAIDRHLQVQSCLAERTATGWATTDCHERRATF